MGVDSYSVVELSKKTGINRTTIYPILEQLKEKGFVIEVKSGKKINYQGETPDRLETYVEQQKLKLGEQSRTIQDIIPQMKSLSRQSGEKAIIKFYEGRKGILDSSHDYFESEDVGGTAYLLYPRDLIEEFFSKTETTKAKEFRLKKGVQVKSIYTYAKGELSAGESSERIRIDANKYPIKCEIGIYKDRVRIHNFGKNLSSIFIKSQDVADTLKILFELAFEPLKEKKNIDK